MLRQTNEQTDGQTTSGSPGLLRRQIYIQCQLRLWPRVRKYLMPSMENVWQLYIQDRNQSNTKMMVAQTGGGMPSLLRKTECISNGSLLFILVQVSTNIDWLLGRLAPALSQEKVAQSLLRGRREECGIITTITISALNEQSWSFHNHVEGPFNIQCSNWLPKYAIDWLSFSWKVMDLIIYDKKLL